MWWLDPTCTSSILVHCSKHAYVLVWFCIILPYITPSFIFTSKAAKYKLGMMLIKWHHDPSTVEHEVRTQSMVAKFGRHAPLPYLLVGSVTAAFDCLIIELVDSDIGCDPRSALGNFSITQHTNETHPKLRMYFTVFCYP